MPTLQHEDRNKLLDLIYTGRKLKFIQTYVDTFSVGSTYVDLYQNLEYTD